MGQAAGSRARGAQQKPGVEQLGGTIQGDAYLQQLNLRADVMRRADACANSQSPVVPCDATFKQFE